MGDSTITLESLGLSEDEIADRIVNGAVERMLTAFAFDDEGEAHGRPSLFAEALKKRITERIDSAIDAIAAKHVLPNVEGYLEGFVLQETNTWGERKGTPVTFTEYLVARAKNYLIEEVDGDGRSKEEAALKGNSWYGKKQSRITHLIHKHLQYSVETAMKDAMVEANKSIAGGIAATVKLKLEEVVASIKVVSR